MKKRLLARTIIVLLVIVGIASISNATPVSLSVDFITEFGDPGTLSFSYENTTPVTFFTDLTPDPEDEVAIFNGALLSFELYVDGLLIGSGTDSDGQLQLRNLGGLPGFGFDDLTLDPAFVGPAAPLSVQLIDDTATANDGLSPILPSTLSLTDYNRGRFSIDSNQTFTFTAFTIVGSNTIPEPATMLLLGTGLAGLVGIRRRKKA